MIDLKHFVRQTELLPRRLRSDDATRDVRRLPATSRSNGFLGVLIDTFDRRGSKGVPIVGAISGSAAARVGLAAGDSITSVGGVGLFTGAALRELISASLPGEHVTVAWVTPQGTGHFACVRLSREPTEKRPGALISRAA
jgi:S1-C subfamily serine protease